MPRQSLLASVLVIFCCLPVWNIAALAQPLREPPRTAAEKSDYQATSTHAEVIAFCEELASQSPCVRLGTLGTSQEGRKLPLVVVADPPIATAAEAAKSSKLVVLAVANIHAGEV